MAGAKQLAALIGLCLALLLPFGPAQAQSLRIFVSGGGNDASTCSRTAPCRTFAGAYGKTLAGGEIDTLDAAGYGSLTITQSISIINDRAGIAGVTGSITVSAPGALVNLRGIMLDGTNTGIGAGLNITDAAHVNIQNCVVQGFNYGIYIEPVTTVDVKIQDTSVIENSEAGLAFFADGAGNSVLLHFERGRLDKNGSPGIGGVCRDQWHRRHRHLREFSELQ